jgi:2,3-bisphosphoglycerate-independent phosphoglycerate mutase
VLNPKLLPVKSSRLLLLFLDGVGVGDEDPAANPLASYPDIWPTRGAAPTRSGLHYVPLDACLGVEGLPQSATGQTALLAGVNAPALIGRHVQGFPSRRLIEILQEESIFVRLKAGGLSATFANAYRFPEEASTQVRLSVTSHALKASGQPFRSLDQLWKQEALTHDFTNQRLLERGYDVPLFSPEEAARILVNLAAEYDFTLYEHFLTDLIAHRGTQQEITDHVLQVTRFIRACLDEAEKVGLTALLTSDHGNLEEASVHTHTRNPVPLIWLESPGVVLPPPPDTIAGVTPWILEILKRRPNS